MKSRVVKGIGKKSRGHTFSSQSNNGAAEESAGNKLYPDGLETSTTYSPRDRDAARSRKNITAKKWKHVATADESGGIVSAGCSLSHLPLPPTTNSKPAGISTGRTGTSSRPPLLPKNGRKAMVTRNKNNASGKENALGTNFNSQTRPVSNIPHQREQSLSVQTASSYRNDTVSKQSDDQPMKMTIDISTPRVRNSGLVDLDDVNTPDHFPWPCGADLAAASSMSAAAASTKSLLDTCVDLDLSYSDDDEDNDDDSKEECYMYSSKIPFVKNQHTTGSNIHGDEEVNTHKNSHVLPATCDVAYGCMGPADVVSSLQNLTIDEENEGRTETAKVGQFGRNYGVPRHEKTGTMGQSQYMYVGNEKGTITTSEPQALFKADSFRSLQSEVTRVADNRSFTIHSNYTFEV